ncbi:sigma-70 family RNA polymerase sigma factor [Actinotalea sp. M2MS4P-6]|uniref:sigma-70 family RNA polymerase sigma factor n=1 Tax=Actinotalea sp. M2MS4P-6 TaxID=2983762 RepID=UPI0021E42458|nr:sigma-70 family RNA polymerase sigma factor [Actinotalea sp. M2MS4P-6]MCV2394908.1 sigma-70 family RNA polymerase sigma factor [Actinotalea sp. M2MS4P-6]
MSHTDEVLVELARERGRDLVAYAYLFTGDHASAQDLVQDAFVKVFGRLRAGFTPDTAEAYVRRAIATLYVDGFRRQRRWAERKHLVAGAEQVPGSAAEVVDRVTVHRALAGLSGQERACVVLRFYRDLTVPEIAAELRLAEGTVKRYLSNAMHKLEGLLGPIAPAAHDVVDVLPPAEKQG